RLGGNAFCEGLVFGTIAGEQAAAYARGGKPWSVAAAVVSIGLEKSVDATAADSRPALQSLWKRLRWTMWQHASLVRDVEGLRRAAAAIDELVGEADTLKAPTVGAAARILDLEKAPRNERGGNTAFTGGLLRFAFESIDDFRPLLPDYGDSDLAELDVGRYSQRDYAADLDRVTEGLSDESMVQILTGNAYSTMVWMRERGVRWLPAMGRQSFRGDDGRYHFFGNLILEAVGGGQGLSDQLFDIVERNGVEIAYATKAVGLQINDQGAITGIR